MKTSVAWRELGSRRVIAIICLNLAAPFLAFLLGNIVVSFQLANHIISEAVTAYRNRIDILCMLLFALITGAVDHFMLVRPLREMEAQLHEYTDVAREAGDQIILDSLPRICIRSAFSQLVSRQKRIVSKNREIEQRQLSSELHALQSRINPHFLYNTLDSIRGLAYYHGIDEIAELTEALSQLFRNMISREGKMLTLRQELANIEDYIRIQRFRFNNNFSYRCEIDEDLLDRYRILNMTLQPIIENAIMHGLEKRIGMGEVVVRAYVTERRLVIRVSDNGAGIPEDKLRELNESFHVGASESSLNADPRHSGIGLTAINRRLKLQFGDKYGLHLSSTPLIDTTTELVLPLIANVC